MFTAAGQTCSWERRLTTYLRADLLLLDDFGLKPPVAAGARGPV